MRLKMAVFLDVTPRSLVDIGRRFRGAYCLRHQGVSGLTQAEGLAWIQLTQDRDQ
jgi:hypothetical protein